MISRTFRLIAKLRHQQCDSSWKRSVGQSSRQRGQQESQSNTSVPCVDVLHFGDSGVSLASEVCHGDGNFVHVCFASSQALSAPPVEMLLLFTSLRGGECLLSSKRTAPAWEADGLFLRCNSASAILTCWLPAQLRWVVFLAPALSTTQNDNV